MFLESTCEEWLLSLTNQHMSLRRQVTLEMPSRKRQRSNSYASGSGTGLKLRVPRMSRPGAGDNRCIIPLTTSIDFDLTADYAAAFAFDTVGYTVNGGANVAIGGTDQIANVFEMTRIQKIEMTILPNATDLGYNNQTLATGTTNIPYVYTAVEYNDTITPTLAILSQNPTMKIGSFNKVIRRTFYPRLEGANGLIDIGSNQKNIFQKTGTSSSQEWHGIKVLIDMKNVVWTYGGGRVTFKVFYECMQSK